MNGNLSRIAFSLNRMRPSDVQVTGIAPTPATMKTANIFHASKSSVSKSYEYTISTGFIYDPTISRRVWHASYSGLDLDLMEQACKILEGTHDFVAFRGAPRGADDKRRYETQNTICNILDFSITEDNPPVRQFKFKVTGDRFLYRMVRFLVGACVAVGSHKLELHDIQRVLEQKSWDIPNDKVSRRLEFECAPAFGLVLRHVNYGEHVSFDWQPLRELEM
jgi:tRNA pseudouridine38-40 synthase